MYRFQMDFFGQFLYTCVIDLRVTRPDPYSAATNLVGCYRIGIKSLVLGVSPSEDPYEEAARQLLEKGTTFSPVYVRPADMYANVRIRSLVEHPEDFSASFRGTNGSLLLYYHILSAPWIRPLRAVFRRLLTLRSKRLYFYYPLRPGRGIRCEKFVLLFLCETARTAHYRGTRTLDNERRIIDRLRVWLINREGQLHRKETSERLRIYESIQDKSGLGLGSLQMNLLFSVYIMRTQALEAGARVDTLEDTGSSS
ncbi:hypothetical protein Tco_0525377 [Tanacetum coccineum]